MKGKDKEFLEEIRKDTWERVKTILILLFIIGAFFYMLSQATIVHAADDPYIDSTYYPYIEEICKDYNISPELVSAIIWKESRWTPDAENEGCIGIMQINEKYHTERMERLGVTSLYDPEQCILVGVDYLAELFTKYEDPYLVLMKYNGTSGAYEKWSKGNYSSYAISVSDISILLEREAGK